MIERWKRHLINIHIVSHNEYVLVLSELYNFIHRSPTKEYHEQTIAAFTFNAPSILLSRVFVKMRRRNCIRHFIGQMAGFRS